MQGDTGDQDWGPQMKHPGTARRELGSRSCPSGIGTVSSDTGWHQHLALPRARNIFWGQLMAHTVPFKLGFQADF